MSREHPPRRRAKEWTITEIHPQGASLFIDGRPAKVGAVIIEGQNVSVTVSSTSDGVHFNPIAGWVMKQQ